MKKPALCFLLLGAASLAWGSLEKTPPPPPAPASKAAATLKEIPQVVDYQQLLLLLPPVPDGWNAEKPNGSLSTGDSLRISMVQRTYTRGDDENAVVAVVTLMDVNRVPSFFDVVKGQWNPEGETAEGYDKRITIDQMPGFEHYSKAAQTVSLTLLVANRFLVQIDVTRGEPGQAKEWLGRIDLKKLATLQK